jgi:hypothetical protein
MFGLISLTPVAAGEPPRANTQPKADVAPDWADGFPLPPGAVRRFGNRQMRHPEGVVASAVSPDGKYLATASYSAVVVWDLKTLTAKRVLSGIHFNNNGAADRSGHLPRPASRSGARPRGAPGPRSP